MSLDCPKCGAKLEPTTFEEVEVDRCPDCRGIWFDVGEEEKLRRTKGSESLDDGDPLVGQRYNSATRIDCPRDGTSMRTMRDLGQPHIQYEVCPQCLGAFFDAGEFSDFKNENENLAELLRNLWR